ncbi:hypothetical protein lerEdw1_015539 [Lerista edwardsae]|nr:hypothetical protein lerEdw1_015539 [Lerista edwardsae]
MESGEGTCRLNPQDPGEGEIPKDVVSEMSLANDKVVSAATAVAMAAVAAVKTVIGIQSRIFTRLATRRKLPRREHSDLDELDQTVENVAAARLRAIVESSIDSLKAMMCSCLFQSPANEIHALVEMRKKERRQLLQCSSDLGGQRQTLVQLTEDGNEKMTEEYKQFCQSMKGLQDDLMELAEQMKFDLDLKLAMLGEEESCAAKLINEMEKKCEQPACEFLQDIKQTLSRYEAEVFKAPEAYSAELKRKLWDLSLRSLFLQDTLKKCSAAEQVLKTRSVFWRASVACIDDDQGVKYNTESYSLGDPQTSDSFRMLVQMAY